MSGRPSRGGGGVTADAEVVVIDDDSSGAAAPRDIPLEMLEKALENGCETLATLATNVMDFSFDSQHVLFSKVYVRPTSERQTSHKYFLLAIELNQCLTRLRNATYRNEFVRDLREIDRRGKNVNASIPMDVIDVIDKGRNPELCTYQMLESCAEASNVVRGKLSAVQKFKAELQKSLHDARAQGSLQPFNNEDAGGKTIHSMHVDPTVGGATGRTAVVGTGGGGGGASDSGVGDGSGRPPTSNGF